MVTADKRAAVEFSLAEQRALMRAAATESAPPAADSRQDDVHPVRGQSERTSAFEFAETGGTNERFGLHDQTLSGSGLSSHESRVYSGFCRVSLARLRQARRRQFAVGNIVVDAPGFEAIAPLVPGHIADRPAAFQFADDEVALGVGVVVGRMGNLEGECR